MSTSKLREVARRAAVARDEQTRPPDERCDLCGEPIAPEHRHLLDLRSRELMCTCRACAILFDSGAAGGGHFRLVPDRRLALDGFVMDDVRWADLRIPVEMAFFFRDSAAGRVVAYYPSPAGPIESLLDLGAWDELERDNPLLGQLEPDVEALLVNRVRGERQHLLVPIEDCYRLVALIRTHWRGLSGGAEVWQEIEAFFGELTSRSKTVTREHEEVAWPR
jgi:hypothetical protein